MSDSKTVIDVAEEFQAKIGLLTEELKAQLVEMSQGDSPNKFQPSLIEVSVAQELLLSAAKQLAISIKKSLLAESEADDPKSIVVATRIAVEMSDHIIRVSLVDELDKAGVDVRAAENYAIEKIKELLTKSSHRNEAEERRLEQELETFLMSKDDDQTFH